METPPTLLITTSNQLDQWVEGWRHADYLGIDTEFVRTRTYYAQLGLVQVFDGSNCVLVDPLAMSDLKPLLELITLPKVSKVLHSGSEDVEIFRRLAAQAPQNLFDTQIAAGLAGLGPSLSYTALVEQLLGETLPKSETRSDWLKRPLSQSQCQYASADVHFLLTLQHQLGQRLDTLGRSHWAQEEFERLASAPLPGDNVDNQFQRFKFAWRLEARERLLLHRLLAWREKTARSRDVPRRYVVVDDALWAIVKQQPQNHQALARLNGIGPGTLRRHGTQLIDLVAEASTADETKAPPRPPPPLTPDGRDQVKALRSIVQANAAHLALEPELLCGRRDLVSLIQTGQLPERLKGWRYPVIGEALEQALQAQT